MSIRVVESSVITLDFQVQMCTAFQVAHIVFAGARVASQGGWALIKGAGEP